jgi:hypothetical protein
LKPAVNALRLNLRRLKAPVSYLLPVRGQALGDGFLADDFDVVDVFILSYLDVFGFFVNRTVASRSPTFSFAFVILSSGGWPFPFSVMIYAPRS